MSYDNNLINQANQNTPTGNALQDTQKGTINMGDFDVTKDTNKVSRCELLNSNSGSYNGDLTDNTADKNPVQTELISPQLQVSLQNPALSFAYPARSSQPTF